MKYSIRIKSTILLTLALSASLHANPSSQKDSAFNYSIATMKLSELTESQLENIGVQKDKAKQVYVDGGGEFPIEEKKPFNRLCLYEFCITLKN